MFHFLHATSSCDPAKCSTKHHLVDEISFSDYSSSVILGVSEDYETTVAKEISGEKPVIVFFVVVGRLTRKRVTILKFTYRYQNASWARDSYIRAATTYQVNFEHPGYDPDKWQGYWAMTFAFPDRSANLDCTYKESSLSANSYCYSGGSGYPPKH